MSKSRKVLARIYAAESINAARNRLFAIIADKENRLADTRRFQALANGQQIHADKALHVLIGISGTTDDNLTVAEKDINHVVESCRNAILTAATEHEPVIESLVAHIMKSAMNHASVLQRSAVDSVDYHVCQICGFIADGPPPDRCPICRAVASQFMAVE